MTSRRFTIDLAASFIVSFLIVGALRSLLPPVFDIWYGVDTSAWHPATALLWDTVPVIVIAAFALVTLQSAFRRI